MTITVLLYGDDKVGKSTLLNAIHSSLVDDVEDVIHTREVKPTEYVEVRKIDGVFDEKEQSFMFWDFSGDEKYSTLLETPVKGDVGVVVVDVTDPASFENASKWLNLLKSRNIPSILCGTKVDSRDRCVRPKDITLHRKRNIMYCEVSSKSMYGVYGLVSKIVDIAK